MSNPLSVKKKLLFSFVTLLVTYGLAEVACTAIMPRPAGSIGSDTFAMQEDTGGYCVDLIRGYSITKHPARVARVTNGVVEYVGSIHGNAQGFQGDRDFTVKRPDGVRCRTLVFGDSFTAAPFLTRRWPDEVEAATPNSEFVNCAIDGAGLANWWSILARMIDPRGYEFDRIIFASIPHDLQRRFLVADHRCEGVVTIGYAGWDPSKFPTDVLHAFWCMNVATFSKVTPEEFDASIRQGKLVHGDVSGKVRPWIASKVYDDVAGMLRRYNPPAEVESEFATPPIVKRADGDAFFTSEQMPLVLDMRDRIKAKHWSVIVIHIPGREELLAGRDDSAAVRDFARLLDARFVDGSKPFRSLGKDEIRACYFPYDAHWNQTGSDRFATYVASQLKG